ncbi:redoxin domain-containing protein [Streptosporangium sp. NPDC051023]|uniref:peroxiredoxin family protein n=1 Tax=Streptosporangium sp. NPDC051023 TaxID=3155410 RepID=UPI00344DF6AE
MNILYIFAASLSIVMIANFVLTAHITSTAPRKGGGAECESPGPLLPIGFRVPEFGAHTVDGEPIFSWEFDRPTVLGFFTAGCPLCEQVLPEFAEVARTLRAAGTNVISVISYDGHNPQWPIGDSATEALARRLGAVSQVVLEWSDDAVTTALRATTPPAFYRVERTDGELRVTGRASSPRFLSGREGPDGTYSPRS